MCVCECVCQYGYLNVYIDIQRTDCTTKLREGYSFNLRTHITLFTLFDLLKTPESERQEDFLVLYQE